MWFVVFFFFFKQKTAYEVRIGDWSSDVCSSDLRDEARLFGVAGVAPVMKAHLQRDFDRRRAVVGVEAAIQSGRRKLQQTLGKFDRRRMREAGEHDGIEFIELGLQRGDNRRRRSEEGT